jgi:hypothetical protein
LKRSRERWLASAKLFVRIGDIVQPTAGASPEDATAVLESALANLAEVKKAN